jgi:hypothetical protein
MIINNLKTGLSHVQYKGFTKNHNAVVQLEMYLVHNVKSFRLSVEKLWGHLIFINDELIDVLKDNEERQLHLVIIPDSTTIDDILKIPDISWLCVA